MPAKIAAPKGFEDILPEDSWKWQAIERIARQTAELYHFREVRTPVMEHSELFHRGVGETTDIVHKETFTFTDRGGDSMTLRPEGTAGVVRAAIEHGLIAQEGSRVKVFYIAPNFRYERPQKGRLRQHHQFGAEAFGVSSPDQDVECILLQMDFYARCGLKDLMLRVNSLGDAESKARIRDRLRAYLGEHVSELSTDSQRRLNENPLRILDSKDPEDQRLLLGFDFKAHEVLTRSSAQHFERVCGLLNAAPFQWVIDHKLVRGFDYYTETLWEVTAGGLGAQNAVGGGGRYDKLVEILGGKPTPGVGFGSGLERLMIALEAQGVTLPNPTKPLHYLVYYGERAREEMWALLRELRTAGLAAEMELSGRSAKAQFKRANDEKAARVLILGDDELARNEVAVKDFVTSQQSSVPRGKVIEYLKSLG